jgi:hypothetical protein
MRTVVGCVVAALVVLSVTGCGGGVTECQTSAQTRAYDPEQATGPFGPALEDLETFDTWVGGGVTLDEDTALAAVLVGLGEGDGCELPASVDVAVWAESSDAPEQAPASQAASYATSDASRQAIATGLVELQWDLAAPIEASAGERVFVAVRLATGSMCAVAASPEDEPRAWRWRPAGGWASLEADNLDIGVGVVGDVGCE